jgi:hypothetical protein
MEQRMGTDQRQHRTEITPLPDGKCKNTICQLLCKGDNDISLASGQPTL